MNYYDLLNYGGQNTGFQNYGTFPNMPQFSAGSFNSPNAGISYSFLPQMNFQAGPDFSSWGSQATPGSIAPNITSGGFNQGTAAAPVNFAGLADLPDPKIDNTPQRDWLDYGQFGLNAAQGLLGGYLGLKQYGLARDQIKFQKEAFNKNYAQNVKQTNRQLEDRQRARVASSPATNLSVTEYMKKYGVS